MQGSPKTVDYEGVPAAACHGDAAAEWAAADSGAALFDATWKRFFPAVGEERLVFLHGQVTADVRSLAPGQGTPAAVLSAQGRPLALLALYEDGERTWIATTAAAASATRAALSRFLVADDCDFEEESEAPCRMLVGPRVPALLEALGAGDAAAHAAAREWTVDRARIGGQAVLVFSRGDLRVPCCDVLVLADDGTPGDAAAVDAALRAAGAVACGVETLEVLRIESGTPRFGVDVDDRRIALEARLEWAIHFAKGCYVGQEVIERAASRGRLNHEIALLALQEPVPVGAALEGGADLHVVTSVAHSPRLGWIALAMLPRETATPGTTVRMADGKRGVEARVLEWPRARVLPGR